MAYEIISIMDNFNSAICYIRKPLCLLSHNVLPMVLPHPRAKHHCMTDNSVLHSLSSTLQAAVRIGMSIVSTIRHLLGICS